MLLKRLTLHNFRGYKDIQVEFDADFSVVIGRNDAGKSTILEALEIFFNSEQVKLDSGDLYVRHDEGDEEIRITCEFETQTDEINIDTSVTTDLAAEYLYNKSGLLEISLVSDGGKKPKYLLRAYYPNVYKTPLVQMKIGDLRKELESRKAEIENYNNINKSIASEIRRAIYESLPATVECEEIWIDITKEDAKSIYLSIQKELPMYFLFKADRENRDADSEVQNPLKIATKNALKEIEDELEQIKRKIQEEVYKIGEETIAKMRELDPDIASSLRTEVSTKAWDTLFSFQLIDDYNVPLNKRGSGIRRLLLLSYLRADAERKIEKTATNSIIYAIEEPETAQHPDYQRKLMESLISLSENPMHQIIITTHTPEIAKMARLEQIIFIKKVDRVPQIVNGPSKFQDIKKTLGIFSSLTSKVVICVEGENDVSFLLNVNRLQEFSDIVDLTDEQISIIPMHGGTLKQWIERDYLKHSNIREIHIYDSDVEDYSDYVCNMNKSSDSRRKGFITKHYEMENYIPRQLVEEYFSISLHEYSDKWNDTLDIPKLLVGKVGIRLGRDEAQREKRLKMILNGSLMKKCTIEMIREMGNEAEITGWFEAIRSAMQ